MLGAGNSGFSGGATLGARDLVFDIEDLVSLIGATDMTDDMRSFFCGALWAGH